MNKLPRRARPAVVWLVFLAVLAAGCAKEGEAGVGVKNLEADLVFGAKDPVKDTRPANAPGPDTNLTPEAAAADVDLPEQVFQKPKGPSFKPARFVPAPCPDAALNAFPAETAPLTVPSDRRPALGTYRWKKSGESRTALTGNQPIGIRGFEQRAVTNLVERGASVNESGTPNSAQDPGVVFEYDTTQPDINGLIVTTTWRVNTSPNSRTVNSPATPHSVRTGEPERGVAIRRILVKNRSGEVVSDFAPVTGLLIVPLPIRPGEHFQSAAVDSSTGASASYEADVVKRDRVDACGTLVEGWLVSGTQSFSGDAGTYTQKYDVIFATGMGLIVSEKTVFSSTDRSLDLHTTLGQTTPDKAL